MTCPIDYKECRSSGCFFHGGVNKICCIKIEQPIFNNGGQIPAYGNEKTAAQVVSELKLENERLKEALKELIPIAQWGYDLLVPFDKKGMGKDWPTKIENAKKLTGKPITIAENEAKADSQEQNRQLQQPGSEQ